jgi:GTP pyrophosphokinase
MVKVREDHPIKNDGTIDLDAWLNRLSGMIQLENPEPIRKACELSASLADAESIALSVHGSYRMGLEMAGILAELQLDPISILASILYRSVREGKLSLERVEQQFGVDAAKLIDGVLKMAAISAYQVSDAGYIAGKAKTQEQIQLHSDNLRKMLVAMIDDVRVALIKLAERTCAIRAIKQAPEKKRRRLAQEVFDIYAPLAHRLGIGHIKWELEDLSFRYLQPIPYKKIATLLDEKRIDRQHFIENVVDTLQRSMASAGIKAQVYGRAKHIYSIWRKMQRKNIDFSQVYDVRAVRIMVEEVKDCYGALGIVHSLWRHIPNEFDDYIANPKSNGYQSLHTAVSGPEGKVLEVQIRTQYMHEEAELGVCAHWLYKGTDTQAKDRGYEQKIAWLRQVLEWHEELGDGDSVVGELQEEVAQDRIYLFTPRGDVVDLQPGATPVDFAYRLHTEVGHRCRGAKVNGRIVPLTYQLHTGEQLEILTAKESRPSRDWLNPDSGYVRSSRARAKITHWFKTQARDENIIEGRNLLLPELQRLALDDINLDELAKLLNYRAEEDICAAIGAGDLRIGQVITAAQKQSEPVEVRSPLLDLPKAVHKQVTNADNIEIQGVGNLLTQIANCCQPVPGDAIVGYVTIGRGVSIHREDCRNLLQLSSEQPGRIMEVHWGGSDKRRTTYPVEVLIRAYDRRGLLRDITVVLANDGVNVIAMNTLTNQEDLLADILLTVEIEDLNMLSRALNKINQLTNVLEAKRHRVAKPHDQGPKPPAHEP